MTIFLQDMGHCRSILDYLNSLADYAYFIERGEVLLPAGKRVITLIHSYGEKGSIFVKAYAKALFALTTY